MINYLTIGKRVASRRKALKIKQYELARRLCVSNNHLCEIEKGKTSIGLDLLCRISMELNVTPDYLILGAMHSNNVSQSLIEKLRLCSDDELSIINALVETFITNHVQDDKFKIY